MGESFFSVYQEWLKSDSLPAGKKKTLEAAVELFSNQGYNGTSTAQIAKRAGVSQATIFKYFKTKEDLLFHIIKPVFPKFVGQFIDDLKDHTELNEAILFFLTNRYHFLEDNQMIFKIIMQEALVNETLRLQISELFYETDVLNRLETWLNCLKENNKQFNSDMTTLEIIRIFGSQLISYFIQNYILLIPSLDKDEDLRRMSKQVVTLLTSS